jgi:hypothetical protein
MRGFMGRGGRIGRIGIGALALVLTAAQAAAQDAATANNSAASEIIAGPNLRDFDLNGTVTRQAAPPATPPARNAPVEQAPTAATQPPPRSLAQRPAPVEPRPTVSPTREIGNAPVPTSTDGEPQVQARLPATDSAPAAVTSLPNVTVLPGEAATDPWSMWPWFLAALAAAGAGLFLFRRHQQQGRAYAAAGTELAFDPAPQPIPQPVPRSPVAAPPRPAADRVVSTRLRPDIDIELLPERAVVDEQGATIEFQVAVRNNGSAPARDVQVEACMVNAGPAQDQELGAFFAHPAGKGSPIPAIPPMSAVTLKSAVRLPLEHMRQFEIAGRKLFVPIVGLNALYRGAAGAQQTSASYLVGRDGNGEKMAPFRLDLGPRIFRGLGARQHSLALRK